MTTISLATIAAFVLPEGLGKPIFNALQTYFKTRDHRRGRRSPSLLAIAADALLVLVGRVATPWAHARRAT